METTLLFFGRLVHSLARIVSSRITLKPHSHYSYPHISSSSHSNLDVFLCFMYEPTLTTLRMHSTSLHTQRSPSTPTPRGSLLRSHTQRTHIHTPTVFPICKPHFLLSCPLHSMRRQMGMFILRFVRLSLVCLRGKVVWYIQMIFWPCRAYYAHFFCTIIIT